MKYLVLTILIFGCNPNGQAKKKESEYKMKCEEVAGWYLKRCENKEVICYYKHGGEAGGVHCKFKESK